jgi:phosphate transport system substrate-binding protein
VKRTTLRRAAAPAATVAALALTLAACGGSNNPDGGSDGGDGALSGTITADGSSTVGPLTAVASELFNEENPDVRISVGESGTGGGFEKFCAGETDLSNASRPISDEDEVPLCEEEGVEYQ